MQDCVCGIGEDEAGVLTTGLEHALNSPSMGVPAAPSVATWFWTA
jgi:hypothetical protein